MLRIAAWWREDGLTSSYGDVKYTANVDEAKEHALALFDVLEIKCASEINNADWFEVVIGMVDREDDD